MASPVKDEIPSQQKVSEEEEIARSEPLAFQILEEKQIPTSSVHLASPLKLSLDTAK